MSAPTRASSIAIARDGRSIVYEIAHAGQLVLIHRRFDDDSLRIIQGSERQFTTDVRHASFAPDEKALFLDANVR